MTRSAALFALLLLAGSALVGLVEAQSLVQSPFEVRQLTREGDNLTMTLRSNARTGQTVVRLENGGVTVGLPSWERPEWRVGEERNWTFSLLRDVDRADVVVRYFDQLGTDREHRESIYVPARPSLQPDAGGTARIVVASAARMGTLVIVNLSNVGDGDARNVVVSLEDDEERKIGSPFARTINSMPSGTIAQVRFEAVEEPKEAVVAIEHANATTRTRVTLVATAPGEDVSGPTNVSLSTELPFREVDVGRAVDYAVTVRNHGRPALVQLSVEGLAAGYSARFFVGGSAVPSLYLDRNQTRQVTLTVTVPNQASEVDRTLDFTLHAHVNGTAAGQLPMGVAVRGVGRLEIQSTGEGQQLPPGGDAAFRVEVRNTGTAPLFNVELDSRRLYGWTVRTEPRRIDRLDPGQAGSFNVEVRAPDVIAGGRYSIDVAAKAGDVSSSFETLGLEVEETSASGGWLWIVFLVIIAGILGAAAWWRWRG